MHSMDGKAEVLFIFLSSNCDTHSKIARYKTGPTEDDTHSCRFHFNAAINATGDSWEK